MRRWMVGLCLVFVAACGDDDDGGGGGGDVITRACRAVAALPCANDEEADCIADLGDERVEAVTADCLAEFEAYLECFADGPLSCDADGDGVIAPEACLAAEAVYSGCSEPAVCAALPAAPSPAQPCATDCGRYAASCDGEGGGPFACSCTSGPNTGVTFEIALCGDLLDVIATECGE